MRPFFQVLRRKLDWDLLHNGRVEPEILRTLQHIEYDLHRADGHGPRIIMELLEDQAMNLAEMIMGPDPFPSNELEELMSLDPDANWEDLLLEVLAMMGYCGSCTDAYGHRGFDAWNHLMEERINKIRVDFADNPDVMRQMRYWMEFLNKNRTEDGTLDADKLLGEDRDTFLTDNFDVVDPANQGDMQIFPLSFMLAAIDGIEIPRRQLESLMELSQRATATGGGGDFEAKHVDPIVKTVKAAMRDGYRTGQDDDVVAAMQKLVQLLTTETSDIKSLIPLFNTFWKQALKSEPPDMQPFAEDANAAKLLWAAAEKADLERCLADWVGQSAIPFACIVDAYLDTEKSRADADEDKDRGFDRLKALSYVCNDIESAYRADDPKKAQAAVDQLKVPDAVRAALGRIVAYHDRILTADSGRFARRFDELRFHESYFFRDAARVAEALMVADIDRMKDAGARQKLGEVYDWLGRILNISGDLKRTIDDFMPKWQALSAGREQWAHLTRDTDLAQLCQNVFWHALEKAEAAIKLLDNAAFLVSIYRTIDQYSQITERATEMLRGLSHRLHRLESAIGKGHARSLVGEWPEYQAQITAIDSDDALREAFLDELRTAHEYLSKTRQGSKALDSVDRLVMHVGNVCVGELRDTYREPEDDMLAEQSAIADQFSGWIYRLGTMTGIGSSNIEAIVEELTAWNAYTNMLHEHFVQEDWPRAGDDLRHISSVRQRASALRARMRKAQLRSLESRIKPRGKAAKSALGDPASLQAIYVLQDEVRSLVNPPQLEPEWFSPRARAWAYLVPPPSNAGMLTGLATYLTELKDVWRQDTGGLKAKLLALPDEIENTPIRTALGIVAGVDPYMSSYLMEAVPDLLLLIQGGVQGPTAAPGFLESHTIDCKLHSETGAEELSSMIPQNMVLELINTTPGAIILGEPLPPPDMDGEGPPCHFILRFRRGTLRPDLANIGLEGPPGNWNVVGFATRPAEHPEYDELFIAGPPDHEILTGQSRHLVLTQMQGSDFGTRNTRILLLHQGLKGPKGALDPGRREKRLSVVHALPATGEHRVELPIYAGFVSSNTVLNDGKSSTDLRIDLTSMVANEHQQQIRFWNIGNPKPGDAGKSRDFWSRSKIILSVDTQDDVVKDDKSWALCTKSQAVAIQPKLMRKRAYEDENDKKHEPEGLWQTTFTSLGARASWIMTPPIKASDDDLTLKRGKSLKLNIEGIETALPNGVANLYLRIENVPGYPDREYVLPVRKTPAVESGGNLGIGTSDPKSKLDVAGAVKADGVEFATLPTGVVMPFAGVTPPKGWLLCDGTPIPAGVEANRALRILLAEAQDRVDWKSDIVRTPNLMGRTVVGAGTQPERTNDDGSIPFESWAKDKRLRPHYRGGAWNHTLTEAEVPPHIHTLAVTEDHLKYVQNLDIANGTATANWTSSTFDHESVANTTGAMFAYYAAAAHNNVQPYYTLNYIIKL